MSATPVNAVPPAAPNTPVFASPFQRLARLLDGLPAGGSPINLTLGEPKHAVPDFVGPVLAANVASFGRYPPIRGTDAFRETVAAWLGRRYGLDGVVDPARMILPLNGSREGLFYAALEARAASTKTVARPAILIPNPFYQAYAAGTVAAGCEPVMIAATAETGFLPDIAALDPALLDRTVALFYASPANPQGAVASLDAWARLIEAARRHDFMLLADECYSEIYRDEPPPGVLQAAHGLGGGFGHVLAFNSLSKRSNLPGLRCGFVAGDPDFIARWVEFRNMAAPQVPLPLQAVAVAAYADEAHVEENRRLYNAKYDAAAEILQGRFGHVTPPGGFFLWLDVGAFGGGEAVAKRLWLEAGLRCIPGGYLAATGPDGVNPGEPFLRIAMVEDLGTTEEALRRLVAVLGAPPAPSRSV
jgi:aspartate/methionine/tyrosine aminotransferase